MKKQTNRDPLPAEVVIALQRGQKIEAIRLLRAARGMGLKEAKDRIEQYVATEPALARKLAAARAQAARGCLLRAAALAALVLGVYLWLATR